MEIGKVIRFGMSRYDRIKKTENPEIRAPARIKNKLKLPNVNYLHPLCVVNINIGSLNLIFLWWLGSNMHRYIPMT